MSDQDPTDFNALDSSDTLDVTHQRDFIPRKSAIRDAYKAGGMDVLEQFVPGILDAIERSQELLPKVFDLVETCIANGNTAGLKEATPLVKALLDENKRLLDRRFGTSVQRTQNEHNVKVQHVSLRGLMQQRQDRNAPSDEIVAEVIDD